MQITARMVSNSKNPCKKQRAVSEGRKAGRQGKRKKKRKRKRTRKRKRKGKKKQLTKDKESVESSTIQIF